MKSPAPPARETPEEVPELNLLLDWHEPDLEKRFVRAGIGSAIVHVLLFGAVLALPRLADVFPSQPPPEAPVRKVIPLIAPPTQLTQTAPNHGKLAKELDLEQLLPQKAVERHVSPPVPPRSFHPAPPRPDVAKPVPVPPLAEPPKIEAPTEVAKLPPRGVVTDLPPPRIQPVEQPKLAFETPGGQDAGPVKGNGTGRIAMPKSTVAEAVRSIARGGGQGGVMVGDPIDPSRPEIDSLHVPPMQGKTGSALELLSDPMGVDFKPYLIRILAAVRRNWLAVLPESVRLGRRGVVQVQFAISRDGSVPKLVIAMPSGAEALDRAAVAGISASNPFPPLPTEFKGAEIHVQFSFAYNTPK